MVVLLLGWIAEVNDNDDCCIVGVVDDGAKA